jgi:hypothetical protein
MGATTPKASQTPRPRRPSAKARANAAKMSKSEPKPRVPKTFVDPEAIVVESSPEPSEPSPSPIERSVDVSDVKYTLAMSCMLGTTPVFTDTKKFKLGQFQLQDFTGTVIKKLAKVVNNGRYTVEWDCGTAVISADQFSKAGWISVDIEEESKWETIEEWIEEFMVKKRVNITAKLVVVYRKVERDDMESQDEDVEPKKGAKVSYRR